MTEKSHRWQKTVTAAAAIALFGLSATQVLALSLGRITVQSSLGEPLRAEIDVPNITAEEAASFKANAASPAAFVAAGLEYNAAMSNLQVSLVRRNDGRMVVRLTSDRPINDPFVDMILEANWSSGRIVRDYTMLFDPPSLKLPAAPAPTLPQVSSVPAVPAAPPASIVAKPAAPAAPEAPRATNPKPAAVAPAKPAPAPEAPGAQQVTVKLGDSASKIAQVAKGSDISLDQMLVAMLRANPDAFLNGNLNRLRAGTVLNIPTAEQAKSIPADEASQTVIAQSKDFNAFRRNLAGSAPKTAVEAPNRKAGGSVDAKVDDKKAANAAADKLTLSKGALKAKNDEAKLAKERADAEAAARAAELAKNIEDLKLLSAATAKKPAAAPAAAASQPIPAAPAVEVAASKAPAPEAKPAASAASAPPKPAVPAPAEEPGLIDQLMEDPTLPLAGGGLLALLGGFALYRRSKSKKSVPHVDSSFLESKLQPESYFGATGGQQVDTTSQDASTGSSSMGYTNSQMGTPDDVDPVAEADVYLAYGRDMQAEEILKEALRNNPDRVAIHTKLLEIYAKRRDTANFLAGANTAFKLVGGESPEWTRICELGLSIDPQNPLYQPGGASASAFVSLDQQTAATEQTVRQQAAPELAAPTTDLDLDLDFSADEAPAAPPAEALAPIEVDQTVKTPAQEAPDSNSLDFDVSVPVAEAPPQVEMPAVPELPDLSFSLDDPAPEAAAKEAPPEAPAPAAAEKSSDGMLEFDLGSLSLDLDAGPAAGASAADAAPADNSLETKLALAEEFVSIGDHDGARALIEEVVAEASGELRERAQRALSNLS